MNIVEAGWWTSCPIRKKDVRVEIFDDHAIWELMYLGKARSPTP